MNRPIFILGCHKSGTTLLTCLLDGHPDLFVVPVEMHLLQYSGHPLAYPMRRQMPSRPARDRRIEWMVRGVKRFTRTEGGYGPGSLGERLNAGAFERFLRETDWNDDASFCRTCLRAIHVGLHGRDLPPGLRVVEKSVENAGLAGTLRQLFPDCLFVHIVRDPYATLVSIRKSMRSHGYPALRRVLRSIGLSGQALLRNRQTMGGFMVARFEDLLTDTEPVMRGIAGFLGLPWHDCLLTPTRLGLPWQGNSTSDKPFTGVSTAPLTAWRGDIFPLEIALANRWLARLFDPFSYPRLPAPPSGLYRRLPHESPLRYIHNRLLLHSRP